MENKETKMTARQFYLEVAAIEGISPELSAFAMEQVEKLNARNEGRKTSPSAIAKQTENMELRAKIEEYLNACGSATAEVIASEIDASKGKVVYQLTQLVNEGTVTKSKGKAKDPYTYAVVEA